MSDAPKTSPAPLPDLTPLPGKQTGAEVTKLVGLMQRLLAPDGCPWDREQTLETLVPYLVEETYEVVDALAAGDADIRTSPDTPNDQFHTLIYRHSGNARLARMLNELNDAFPRNVSALVLRESSRHREENFREHAEIVDALAAGDHEMASAHMRDHVLRSGQHLANWYERRSSTVFTG